MAKVFFLLGGNQSDRNGILTQSIAMIDREIGKVCSESSIYETDAWGFDCNDKFLNKVVVINTDFTPHEVLSKAQAIENRLGRIRKKDARYSSRTIDIDILFYDNEIINTKDLQIPHPRIQERNFALIPLLELDRNYLHPTLKKSIEQLLTECKDSLDVRKIA
ncbi:MAG: 2-amino-4-hydroxy-6-hydroxymethyldihydropteridine diphosphokinase [Marinifilaceae bacterium]|jgi:2-amino-4-hydroxy-6-hydroxymethyldihydropteridine diphosphokinase|nr:2-amino-4-hydroxy-6-hydroxymethyldihydropteridine diphosphokinase [Marinifilaceae bacterium]